MDEKKAIIVICLALIILYIARENRMREEADFGGDTSAPTKKKRPPSGGSPIIPTPVNPSPASTLNILICEDENCTIELTSINWGAMSPGESKNKTVYIKNNGNIDVTVHIKAGDWEFKDCNGTALPVDYAQYFNLTWNIEGLTIRRGETVMAVVTLTVSPFIHTVASFAFTIYVEYEAQP